MPDKRSRAPITYPDLRDDQMLAIAVYGETVAAYRYTVLAEKVPERVDRDLFAAIADEEHGHKQRIQALQDRFHPDASFYLSEDDKALVCTGPRLINIRGLDDYREVVQMALDTEYRVACFYQAMSTRISQPEIGEIFRELSRESFDHHRRLTALARSRGFLPERGEHTMPPTPPAAPG